MKPFLLDVRTPEEFNQGNVAGSVNIPMDDIPDNLEKIRGIRERIVIICHSGARAHVVQSFFRQNGIDNTEVLEGGVMVHGFSPKIL